MIEKIISNGQTGVAVAALDVAIKLGLDYGGWCCEGEPVADKYRLMRMPEVSWRSATEKAVGAADGSLFVTDGQCTSLRCETTSKAAFRFQKPFLVLDLAHESGFPASRRVALWIVDNRIKILHVDGEDEGPKPSAVAASIAKIMEAVFFLATMETGVTSPLQSVVQKERLAEPIPPPKTMEEALNHLEQTLLLKDKTMIANMVAGELVSLQFTLGDYINSHFELFTTNTGLLEDCRHRSGQGDLGPKDLAAVIIRALWDRLRATCRLRVVK